ncbi:MAG: hypothetical protein IPL54_02835 [Chitinophagaceae bacterium]|nr:hypothetical protein [Chitinophagaceae bacterium]
MKIVISLLVAGLFIFSCNNPGKQNPGQTFNTDTAEKQRFFPVTAYIRGEIFNLKQSGINPLKYITVNDRTDSVWLKIEDLENALQEFLQPEIDSANLTSLFTEKSFMDQSIDAVTFTYDPIKVLPDSMKLNHWDVYVNPKTNKVKRIYMVKDAGTNKIMQLTWLSNQWCKIVSIVTNEKGESKIEKEEKFILDF